MPPSVHSLPPERARRALEKTGYYVAETTEYNWVFKRITGPPSAPIIVPHSVSLIPLEIANYICRRVVGIGDYLYEVDDFIKSQGY